MSFLQPVSHNVLHYNNGDLDAPQINYNKREASDILNVIKACLVTGYGNKAAAGWSVSGNTTQSTTELLPASPILSDYTVLITDTISSTNWSYNYQGINVKPNITMPPKVVSDIDKQNPLNGWHMIVTAEGFWFIEKFYVQPAGGILSRFLYFGRVKSALIDNTSGKNIAFMSFGQGTDVRATNTNNTAFINGGGVHYELDNFTKLSHAHAAMPLFSYGIMQSNTTIELADSLYIVSKNPGTGQYEDGSEIVGMVPGIMLVSTIRSGQQFVCEYISHANRPMLRVSIGRDASSDPEFFKNAARFDILIYLDYWEY